MLKRLYVKNFTVFAEADFAFGPGLNVVVGTNGTGKSHVLKLGYAAARTSQELGAKPLPPSKANWQETLAERLQQVFLPDSLGRLARRTQGTKRAEVEIAFSGTAQAKAGFSFYFATSASKEVKMEVSPTQYLQQAPVFLPTKEVVSIFPGLRGLFTERAISLDLTYPDLCARLDTPLSVGPRLEKVKGLLAQLEAAMGGHISNDNGRFYLKPKTGGKLEINLVAEGVRKLATLAYLLNNGSLNENSLLFWDEPEANLNPALLKELAAVLVGLTRQGFQIILATHSLFLLKELHILSRPKGAEKLPMRYFGLNAGPDGATTVNTVDDFEKLPDIVALDVEMEQADTLTLVFAQDDADHHGEKR